MKRLCNLFLVDLQRGLLSPGFALGCLAVFGALYYGVASDMHPGADMVYLFSYAVGYSQVTSIIIIACTFAYSAGYCADHSSRFMYAVVGRGNYIQYTVSKVLACSVSGGLSVAGGAALFLLFLIVKGYPLLPDEAGIPNLAQNTGFGYLFTAGMGGWYFIFMLAAMYSQGAFWACLGLCASGYFPQSYFAFAAPYILSFVIIQVFTAAFTVAPIPMWLHPVLNGLGRVDMGGAGTTLLFIIAYFAILIILCGLLFYHQVKRRGISAV